LTHKTTTTAHGIVASPDDIRRIIANLDDEKLLDIIALQATVRDVEEASLWLAGDSDVFGAGKPLSSIAEEIVAILTADEEEEPRPVS
jgi:hypothetical protein